MSAATSKVRSPRVKYPEGVIRTREQILAQLQAQSAAPTLDTYAVLHRGWVWVTCHNCGGRGNYPSAMTPPGLCRLYCWAKPHTDPIAAAMGALPPMKDRDDPTFGRLARSVDKYVKSCQTADRAAYREELARPAREAAQRQAQAEREAREEAERAEFARQQADVAERKAISQHVGAIGDKIDTTATLVDCFSFEGKFGWRTQYRFRDDAGNVLVWWTGAAIDMAKGERAGITGTVKDHGEYDGERQTTLLRVKVKKQGT